MIYDDLYNERQNGYVEDMLDDYANVLEDAYMQPDIKPYELPDYIKDTLKVSKKFVKKCGKCGKEFVVPMGSHYRYRDYIKGKYRFFCSWTCLSISRKEKKEKKK